MQERYISSGSSRLHIAVWEPSGERKAIMQISHGMIEYIKRYSHFANYLNQAGILVIGNDHKGHGLTAEKDDLWRGADRCNYLRDRLHAGGSSDGRKTLCGCDQ